MNSYRRIPITVVIVDSGPLISLAASAHLDLLDCFQRRVRITDVVRAECLRYPDKIGATELASWFQSFNGDKYRIVDTPLLDDWHEAVKQEEAGDDTHPSKGIGDASITWLIQRINSIKVSKDVEDEIILVLSDDSSLGDSVIRARHPEVYMLSTRLFLQVLENFSVIPSATAIMREIVSAGRTAARYAADRPGKVDPGTRSQWADVLARDSNGPKSKP